MTWDANIPAVVIVIVKGGVARARKSRRRFLSFTVAYFFALNTGQI